VDEYHILDTGAFIEWAENLPNLIPDSHSIITIKGTRAANVY
jgi:tRNA threonylcarbamoyladenosine biosynthesis protein TsaE